MIPNEALSGGKPELLTTDAISERVMAILEKHGADRSAIIAILGDIQAEFRYLPADAMKMVAERTGAALVDVYGAATFYRSFSLKPKGKHLVCACLGTACHVRGGPRVAEEFERQLGIRAGETTPDEELTLETVNCLGACALGPVVVIDGHYFSKVGRSKVKQLVDAARVGLDTVDAGQDERIFPIEVGCPKCNRGLMEKTFPIDGHPSIGVTALYGKRQGWLRLSSLYGSHKVLTEHEIPAGAVVDFSCPHCGAGLMDSWECPTCGAAMAQVTVHCGGTMRFCSRAGCANHMLDLE